MLLKFKVFGLVILILVASAVYIVYSGYWDAWRYRGLLSNIPPDVEEEEPIDLPPPSDISEGLLTPAYPETAEIFYETAVVSTGEFRNFTMKNAYSGGDLAQATALKFIAKDSQGNPRVFEVVVQIIPKLDFQNIIAWLARRSAEQRGFTMDIPDGKIFSAQELSEIFPQGSPWLLFPFINYDADGGKFAEVFPDYVFNARQYYGDDVSIVKDYFAGDLKGTPYRRPVLSIQVDKL